MVITDAPQLPLHAATPTVPGVVGVPVPVPTVVPVVLPDKSPIPESHAATSRAIQQPTSNARPRGCLRRNLGNGKLRITEVLEPHRGATDRTFYVAFPQTVVPQRRVPFGNARALSLTQDCYRNATKIAAAQTALLGRWSQHHGRKMKSDLESKTTSVFGKTQQRRRRLSVRPKKKPCKAGLEVLRGIGGLVPRLSESALCRAHSAIS